MVISVKRKEKHSEKVLRHTMIVLAVLFLLMGIMLTRGFMLLCFLMTVVYFWYSRSSKREYEYTIEDGRMIIDRVADHGRTRLHDFPLSEVEVLAKPDDPAVARYKRKGGTEKIPKYDYTSYEEDQPYYTMIVQDDGQKTKLLLDLTPEAIAAVRRANPPAVQC